MNQNLGLWERALRILVGVVLLALAVVGPQTVVGLLGVVPFITGAMGMCPLYGALGITSFRGAIASSTPIELRQGRSCAVRLCEGGAALFASLLAGANQADEAHTMRQLRSLQG